MSKQQKFDNVSKNSSSIWFLIIGISTVTLYFNTKAYDPFNTPKLIILLVISGWILGHIFNHYRTKQSRINKKEFIFLLIPMLFMIAQLYALLFTDIFLVGLIGDTQRRNGFLSYFALTVVLIFCMISINYQYALRILKSAIVIGVLLCAYGFMQITGNDFVSWNNPYNSMIATVGNPNFASSLLALISLIAFFSLFNKEFSKIYKTTALSVILTSIYLIVESQSRQGLLVLSFALLFYFTVLIFINYKKFRVLAIVTSLVITSFAILGMLQMGPLSSLLYKSSVTVRGYYWRAAWEMFLEKPLTGVGLDRYGAYFKQFREQGYTLNYGFDITSSNAHNVYLQLFSTGGLFVGLTYLALLALILFAGIQNTKRTTGNLQRFNLMYLATWIGFQAQSLISIDNIGISIWGWLIGGCILGINLNSSDTSTVEIKSRNGLDRKNSLSLYQPTVSFLFLIPILILAYNLHRIETNTFLAKAYSDPANAANKPIVLDYANKVISNPISDPFYKLMVSLYMADMGEIAASYATVSNLHEKDPRNLDNLRWLVEYEKSKKNSEKELEYRQMITKLDPWNAVNYFEMGLIYKQKNDQQNMIKMREIILNFAAATEIADKAAQELI
jgi:putative inorganic carbon (HCO3(-)) transporter